MVGAHNGLTARLAERAGFEAVWASGFEISASYALPDASILTMTQLLEAADAMNAATLLPVIADCDTGFGGPLHVAHTVRSYERRGIAGICIEDKLFPKLNSFAACAQELVPIEEFGRKVTAGKVAQTTDEFLLIARTEALVVGLSLDEALSRADAYREAVLTPSWSTAKAAARSRSWSSRPGGSRTPRWSRCPLPTPKSTRRNCSRPGSAW